MLKWLLNEKTIVTIGALFASACAVSAVTNVVSNKRKAKKHKETDVEELIEEDDGIEIIDLNGDTDKAVDNKPAEAVVIDVDQNGNVVTPIKFNHQDMIINPDPV